MNTTLTNLQSKTDQEKAVLATLTAISITVLLFLGWGYNFAHSGKIGNLASSAAGAASAVEGAKLDETFNTAIEQFKAIGNAVDISKEVGSVIETKEAEDSVGAKHINVFNTTGTDQVQQYGENVGDVLY